MADLSADDAATVKAAELIQKRARGVLGRKAVEEKRAGVAAAACAPEAESDTAAVMADLSADDAATVKAAELIQKRARGVLGRKAVEEKRAGRQSALYGMCYKSESEVSVVVPVSMRAPVPLASIVSPHSALGSPLPYKSIFSDARGGNVDASYQTPAKIPPGYGDDVSCGSVDSAAKKRKRKPLYLRIVDNYQKKISEVESEKVSHLS
jgi:hypothetical protein